MSPQSRTCTKRSPKSQNVSPTYPTWPNETELVGIELELSPPTDGFLYAQYTIGLHAWFLNQVRQSNPVLSTLLHDKQEDKAFTLSGLDGSLLPSGTGFRIRADRLYRWTISALSQPVAQWLAQWVKQLPEIVELRNAPLLIRQVAIAHPPTTYAQLWQTPQLRPPHITLSFTSPTSFRRKGLHLPLPWPPNVFHSYLRRWNCFSGMAIEPEPFLDWVETSVLIRQHRLASVRTVAGKKGTVTGFTGAVELSLSPKAQQDRDAEQLFFTLVQLAPYCGTGHKTTFGLGQTRLGWQVSDAPQVPSAQDLLAQRIADLTPQLL